MARHEADYASKDFATTELIMGALITYSDTEPRWHDTSKITLDKILQALNDGAGGGGSGTTGLLDGFGAPGAGLGSNGNLYVDKTNRDLYAKIGGTWELIVDWV